MRAAVIVLITLAVLAAGGVAFFVNRLVAPQTASMPSGQPVVTGPQVLVAQAPVEPGAAVGRGAMTWHPWPEDKAKGDLVVVKPGEGVDVEAAKAEAEKQFEGMSARRAITAGEPLTLAKVFKRDGATFMPGAVAPGMRAVAVPVTADRGVAGFVLPGDFVDVIVAHDVSKSLPRDMAGAAAQAGLLRLAAEIVVSDVRVMAVDQTIYQEPGEGSAVVVKTVTLEVAPQQAAALSLATQMGELALALRPLGERGEVAAEDRAVTDMELSPTLSAAVGRGLDRGASEGAPEEDAGPPRAWTVNVNRGGKVNQVYGY